MKMKSKSGYDYKLRGDNELIIREEDWQCLGDAFAYRLNHLTKDDKAIFPRDAKFKFIYYKFGKYNITYHSMYFG